MNTEIVALTTDSCRRAAALICAGERVTEEIAAYLASLDGRRSFGLGPGGTLACVR